MSLDRRSERSSFPLFISLSSLRHVAKKSVSKSNSPLSPLTSSSLYSFQVLYPFGRDDDDFFFFLLLSSDNLYWDQNEKYSWPLTFRPPTRRIEQMFSYSTDQTKIEDRNYEEHTLFFPITPMTYHVLTLAELWSAFPLDLVPSLER